MFTTAFCHKMAAEVHLKLGTAVSSFTRTHKRTIAESSDMLTFQSRD